jgi:hypothetical protein
VAQRREAAGRFDGGGVLVGGGSPVAGLDEKQKGGTREVLGTSKWRGEWQKGSQAVVGTIFKGAAMWSSGGSGMGAATWQRRMWGGGGLAWWSGGDVGRQWPDCSGSGRAVHARAAGAEQRRLGRRQMGPGPQ